MLSFEKRKTVDAFIEAPAFRWTEPDICGRLIARNTLPTIRKSPHRASPRPCSGMIPRSTPREGEAAAGGHLVGPSHHVCFSRFLRVDRFDPKDLSRPRDASRCRRKSQYRIPWPGSTNRSRRSRACSYGARGRRAPRIRTDPAAPRPRRRPQRWRDRVPCARMV